MSITDLADFRRSLEQKHTPIKLNDNASFELVFKIQETCNINCNYCYMYNVGNELYRELPVRAGFETCRKVGEMLANEFSGRNPRKVRLILHGGEPMLMKVDEFDARLRVIDEVLRRRLAPDQRARVDFSLQTNATLVSDAWIDLLHRWNVSVGVSIDGPAAVHDERRQDKRGRGTHAAVARGIRRLNEAHGAGKISALGALCVINHRANGAEVYNHIVHELGIKNLDFLLPFMNWETYDKEVVRGVGDFLLRAFDAWVADLCNHTRVQVRIFRNTLLSLSRPLGRFREGFPVGHQVVVVESDGSILPEESLRLTYNGRFSALSIHRNTAHEVLNDPRFYLTLAGNLMRAEECDGCALVDSCASGHGIGRVGMRYSRDKLFQRKTVYCEAFVELYVRAAAFLANERRPLTSLGLKVEDFEQLELGAA